MADRLSRRDFVKDIGLGTIGMGLGAMAIRLETRQEGEIYDHGPWY